MDAFRDQIKETRFDVPILELQTIRHLLTVNPTVTHLNLSVSHLKTEQMRQICNLLNSWSPTLVSLKLILTFARQQLNADAFQENAYSEVLKAVQDGIQWWSTSQLLDGINGLSRLMNLTLVSNRPLLPSGSKQLDLPILGRLRQFTFATPDSGACLLESFCNYGVDNLESINLENTLETEDLVDGPFADGRFVSTFRHISLDAKEWRSLDHPMLRLTPLLTSLTSLNLTVSLFPSSGEVRDRQIEAARQEYCKLITCLAGLKQLVHLKLNTPLFSMYPWVPIESQLLQLPTVRYLSLELHAPGSQDNQVEFLCIGTVFPNLQCLTVNFTISSDYLDNVLRGRASEIDMPYQILVQRVARSLYWPVKLLKIESKIVTFNWKNDYGNIVVSTLEEMFGL